VNGESVDDPQIVNLVQPLETLTINGMQVDMHRFAEAAKLLGADKRDVLSISGYRNAKGQLVPDYSTIRIERKADQP
jgi:hypothetical protein